MLFRGLRTNITIHLAILLLFAMFLIDFVVMMLTQRDLIQAEISKGNLLTASIESSLSFPSDSESTDFNGNFSRPLERLFDRTGFSCIVISGPGSRKIYSYGVDCHLKDEIARMNREVLKTGQRRIRYFGTTWGNLWKQRRFMIISSPLFTAENTVVVVGILLKLERIYRILRRSQQILFIYILVNVIILTLIGLHQLSKKIVTPVHRLVKNAENYGEDDDIFFMPERGDNEFHRLSKALNRLLKRISADKEKLLLSVKSLEKANLDLKQAQKDIIRAEKLASVGRLSAGIAHEIGNPIGIVIGYLELLKQSDISESDRTEYIDRACKEINRISKIIRQLLELSRSSGEGLSSVSVHEIIDDMIEVLKHQPLMANIDFRCQLSAEKDRVIADPNQLRQVFLNLAINAADAISSVESKTDGQLIISSEVTPAEDGHPATDQAVIKICCTDNGPGISAENLANVFDPFFTTKEPGKGTGLGLSVCFMIVEGLKGKIEATSEIDKGTSFCVFLPLVPEETNSQPPTEPVERIA